MKINIHKYNSVGEVVDVSEAVEKPTFLIQFTEEGKNGLVLDVEFIKNDALTTNQVLTFKGLMNCRYALPNVSEGLCLGECISLIYEAGELRLECRAKMSVIRIPISSQSYPHIDRALDALLN